MANFSAILKRLREELELTQEQLATRLNISRSRLASYEQGTREPDLEMLEIFADFFNVDIDYLVGRSDQTTKLSDDEIHTFAAHKNNPDEEWTPEELEEIERFKEFVKLKRKSMK
ncbi:MAG: helix-turn-helix transcriptional regulator [Clostridiaceae bacterium]